MKKYLKFVTVFLLVNTWIIGEAQVVEEPYEVGTWKGFTEAAITYTFDDNCANQYVVAIPMFNEFGFKATFYPVINWSPDWTEFQSAADSGHEIGSHTVSHPYLDELSDSMQNVELKNARETINSNITGQSCLSLAYPYCVPSDDTITGKYYIAARHCQGYIESSTPADFYNISSIICGSQGSLETFADFKNKANEAAASNGWNVYLLHGIDGDGGYSPVTSGVLRKSLEYLDYNRDRFWVSSFVHVVRYIRERNAVSVTEPEYSEDTIKVEVTDTLDNIIYGFPVTIRRPMPETWNYAAAWQNGEQVETFVRMTDTVNYVEFNVVPDAGTVILVPANKPPFSPEIDRPYEVATWKGFTEAAITYTFDDNSPNHYSVVIPMFNTYGFDVTFYPVIDWSPNWTTFQAAADAGHEIGSHTVSHPHLGELSDTLQNEELKDSQEEIDAGITDQTCYTLAYPYCEPSDDTITSKYYIAARHCQGEIETTTPDDFYNISSILCGGEGLIVTGEEFNTFADSAAGLNGWSIYLLHGIDSDGGYSPVTSEDLEGSLEYLDDNRDIFWVSNFVNVVRYIRERNAVSLTVTDMYADSILVQVTDTLDDVIYDYPVTFHRKLPSGWPLAKVYQDGDSVETYIIETETETYIEFNVVPDKGTVVLMSAEAPEEQEDPENIDENLPENVRVSVTPNPFSSEILIQAEGRFVYAIHALDGKMIDYGSGYNSEKTGSQLPPGLYVLTVRHESKVFNAKIIRR